MAGDGPATLRDRAQAEVAQADGGYAGAWQAARDAGWTPALLRGMGYPQPAATRPARRPANSATAADPSLATAAGGATRTSSAGGSRCWWLPSSSVRSTLGAVFPGGEGGWMEVAVIADLPGRSSLQSGILMA
jgi:hypothetical protein